MLFDNYLKIQLYVRVTSRVRMYRTIFACIIISVPIFITMEIAIRILDCLMGYKSSLLSIKRKMLGIKCDNDDIYDEDVKDDNKDGNNDGKDVRDTDE